ncbi:MAG: hypothetical protein ACOX78_02225 [Lachnospiraceae bacterium]|jgi:hypothetical protein
MLFAAAFCALFAAVYESFSHQVYSLYMILAFLYPLAGAVLYTIWIGAGRNKAWTPSVAASLMINSAIALFTVGSLFLGVLEIYGTTNHLSQIYFIAAFIFLAAAIAAIIAGCMSAGRNKRKRKQQ